MKLIAKLIMVCILCTLFACGGVSASNLLIDVSSDIGYSQVLYLDDIAVTDWGGNRYTEHIADSKVICWHDDGSHIATIGLPKIWNGRFMNYILPFKEVTLKFTLARKWGFGMGNVREDTFTLDVTNLVTINLPVKHVLDGPDWKVKLKASNSYQVGKADAVTIYDGNGNKLIHFPATHKEGHFSS